MGSPRLKRRSRPARLLAHLALIVAAGIMLYPIIWMLGSSLKPESKIFSELGPWPNPVRWANYADGWAGSTIGFSTYFFNSAVIAVLAVVGNLFSCSLAGFAFARLQFRGQRLFFALMMGTIMLPFHVVVVPQYIMFSELGWTNTIIPLVMPKFLAVDAFFIFLMVQFLRAQPEEIMAAARVDGAGAWQIYRHIVVPLTVPALATTAIFTFIWTWNDFFAPLIYLNDPRDQTVPLGLNAFLDSTGDSAWGPMFAMACLSLGPAFGFFLAGQRYLVDGIATTGLKG